MIGDQSNPPSQFYRLISARQPSLFNSSPANGWPGNEERECPPRTHPSSPGFWTPAARPRFGALSSQHLLPFSWRFFDQPSAPSSPSHLVLQKSCPLGIHWKMGPPSASAITHKVKQNMKTRRRFNRKWRPSIKQKHKTSLIKVTIHCMKFDISLCMAVE